MLLLQFGELTFPQACIPLEQKSPDDIDVVYLIQEEDTSHHFHVWVFPRYDWMLEQFGKKTPSLRPIMEYARENLKTPDNLKKVEEAVSKLKSYFDLK